MLQGEDRKKKTLDRTCAALLFKIPAKKRKSLRLSLDFSSAGRMRVSWKAGAYG
jgi:hypothetical protein